MPRISSIPSLGTCPGFAVLRASGADDGGSKAADTGSAVGRVIQLWHQGGEGAGALEEAMQRAVREAPEAFPQADLDEARTWALMYAADPRNRGVVLPDSCEQEVRLALPAAPEDPTGAPVEFVGHMDQVRRVQGQLRVWDLKSGKGGGLELLYTHAWQLAAYALAATEAYNQPVLPGGVIRLRGYTAKTSPPEANAHFDAPWSLEACRTMLATAVQHVAWLRLGLIHLQPGIHCQWCPGGGPANCGERIDRVREMPRALVGG